MNLGKNIASLRKERNLSQEELAELLEVSRQTISNWELGDTMPTSLQVMNLAKIFKVSTDDLLGLDAKEILVEKVNRTEKLVKKQFNFTKRLFITIYIIVLVFLLSLGIYCFTLKDFTMKNQLEFDCNLDSSKIHIELESGGHWEVYNCLDEECPRTFNAKEKIEDYLYVIKVASNSNSEYYGAGFSLTSAIDNLETIKKLIISKGGSCK